jgi:hypothetical protein
MKTISLWQPWASLIANGIKRFETRSWATTYRGPLAIHAAKKVLSASEQYQCLDYEFLKVAGIYDQTPEAGHARLPKLPHGAVIATCTLADCIPTDSIGTMDISRSERLCGDFTFGRFAWLLGDVKKLASPIPFKGRQGFFDVPDSLFV